MGVIDAKLKGIEKKLGVHPSDQVKTTMLELRRCFKKLGKINPEDYPDNQMLKDLLESHAAAMADSEPEIPHKPIAQSEVQPGPLDIDRAIEELELRKAELLRQLEETDNT